MKTGANLSAVEARSEVSMRCPACRKHGLFHPIYGAGDVAWSVVETRKKLVEPKGSGLMGLADALGVPVSYTAGMRRCPNAECLELAFVVQKEGKLIESFPPEALDLDLSSLPQPVADSLGEAVRCHAAGCYRAAALMVRRSLEEICDHKGAKGRDLRARIDALKDVIVVSGELLDAAHELRILGNDAAHIEGRAYDSISAVEVEVAIELTKELIKAIYQHAALVERMRALKKGATD